MKMSKIKRISNHNRKKSQHLDVVIDIFEIEMEYGGSDATRSAAISTNFAVDLSTSLIVYSVKYSIFFVKINIIFY